VPGSNESELTRLLAQAQARQSAGDPAGAEELYRRALAASPDHPAATHGLAVVLLRGRNAGAAATVLERALASHPRDAMLLATLGLVRKAQGRVEDATGCLESAVALAPELAEAWVNLGNVYEAAGRWTRAEDAYRRALVQRPDLAVAHANLGTALQAQGRVDDALECYRHALALRPDYTAAYDHMGTALLQSGRAREAGEAFRRALALAPGNVRVLKHLGDALQTEGRLDDALACYREARAADAADVGAVAGEAAVLEWQGHKDAAAALINPLIAAGSDDLSLLLLDARLCGAGPDQEKAIARLEMRLARASSRYDRRRLHFALGQLYDRAGNPGAAFEHVVRGNGLKDARYDPEADEQRVTATIAAFSAQDFPEFPRSSLDSSMPIFIVGMPRSGTTLVERILGAHPAVRATGERDAIYRLASTVARNGSGYPDAARNLSSAELTDMARAYLDELGVLPSAIMRVTDKMPFNFFYLGFIAMLFPRARVVHCARDPLDTCLSCFFQDFGQGHAFAYDLENLGVFFRLYRRLMAHWESLQPLPLLTLRYERLVAEPEAEVRGLLEFCGLPWEPRCLRFHETQATALTASYDQVRRPLYTGSVGRHRAYAAFLDPLRQALAAAAPPA